MPHAGEMRDLVTVSQPADTIGADGQQTITWSTYATRWAKFEFVSMTEGEKSGKVEANTVFRLTMRHDSAINEMMRITFDDITMQISSITFGNKRRWMTVYCTRVR
jgi:SPP1 family predicted phage head-tail adaptor